MLVAIWTRASTRLSSLSFSLSGCISHRGDSVQGSIAPLSGRRRVLYKIEEWNCVTGTNPLDSRGTRESARADHRPTDWLTALYALRQWLIDNPMLFIIRPANHLSRRRTQQERRERYSKIGSVLGVCGLAFWTADFSIFWVQVWQRHSKGSLK